MQIYRIFVGGKTAACWNEEVEYRSLIKKSQSVSVHLVCVSKTLTASPYQFGRLAVKVIPMLGMPSDMF